MEEKTINSDRALASALAAIETAEISAANRRVLFGYVDECLSQGLSKLTVVSYARHILALAKWLGSDLEDAELPEIKRLAGRIEASAYVEQTKLVLKMCLKRLYAWLRGTEDYPPEVRWIKLRTPGGKKPKLPEEVLTQDEVVSLIRAAANPRDKALIALLYETGCRIGEVLFLRLRSIGFDKHGALVSVPHFGKTGSRRIRIVSSVPDLKEWLNKRTGTDSSDSYLWPGQGERALGYGRVRAILREVAAKAGVRKPVNPHSFRHARATHLASHLTEAQMKEYFGWVQGSGMAAIYVHLSGRDVDEAILKLNGIQRNEQERERQSFASPSCPKCEFQNPIANKFCSRCGMILDQGTAVEMVKADMERNQANGMLDELIKDEEFRTLFVSKMRQLTERQTVSTG